MFRKIAGLTISWIGAFALVKIFGPRLNLVFVVPGLLTASFVYSVWLVRIGRFPLKRGWILAISISCETGIVVGTCLLLSFLSLSLILEMLIGLGGIAAALVVGFLLVFFWWAPRNLYFTFVPEGRAKIVVRADAFEKTLIQWKGHALAVHKSEIVDTGDVIETEEQIEAEGWLKKLLIWLKKLFGGLRYYGFWPILDIYIYDFAWTNVAQNGEIVQNEKKGLDYVLLKDDVYFATVKRAEDKGQLPSDIHLLLTLRVINPYKAVFVVQTWLEAVINTTEAETRDVWTTDSYARWISSKKNLAERIEKALEGFRDEECSKRYGVEIRAIKVRNIDPEERFREATLKGYLAERERDRVLVEADAEKQRIAAVYEAVKKYGDLGKLIRSLEALETSPEKGAKWVVPIPAGIIPQIFPGETTDSLAKDDLETIRGLLEELQQEKKERRGVS